MTTTVEDLKPQMIETLKEIANYLDRLTVGCSQIRESLQGGRVDDGQLLLAEFLEGIHWVTQGISVSRAALADFGVEIDLTRLEAALGPATEALENQDYGLIGDVMEYEVQPVLRDWRNDLRKISKQQ